MNGIDREDSAAVDYYCKIIAEDDVLLLKDLIRKIPKASSAARRYLQAHCHTFENLKEFFEDNDHYFYIENGRVALYNEELETAGDLAEAYFVDKLQQYEGPIHFMTLKRRHMGAAPDIVGNFITRFYPGREFKRFLKARPNVFVLDKHHKVFLVEVDSVTFFEKRLEVFGRDRLHYIDFRGHVGQAPPHVRDYINRKYPGDEFQIFLSNNSDVFRVSEDGFVSLVPLR